MVEHVYPGVYLTEVATAPRPIPGVPTSTSGPIDAETIGIFHRLIKRLPPDWTDGNQHDPGIALLELAAWLAESVAYRGGRAPDKAVTTSARLALASLALASDRRQPQGSAVARVRFFEGQLLDERDLNTEVDYKRCLKIIRPRGKERPLDSFRYQVLVDGTLVAGFDEADGVSARGGEGLFDSLMRRVQKLLGLRKYATIVLKRGLLVDRTLADWYRNSQANRSDRRAVVIKRAEPSFSVIHVSDAWINKIEGPDLNASGNDIAIETLELVHEGIRIECP